MRRIIMLSLCFAVGVTMMVAVFLRQNRLATLKAEQAHVLARLTDPAEMSLPDAPANPQNVKQSSHSPSIELLRLRAEVTRLGNRKRELANARVENERLRIQLATRGKNVPGAVALPAGYIRKSEARFVGYNTPEETIQTMLWAIQNRDSVSFLQAFDPKQAKALSARMQTRLSAEEFFKQADSWPGIQVVGKEAGTDGEVVLIVELMPDNESPMRIRFKQFGGQWKMVEGS